VADIPEPSSPLVQALKELGAAMKAIAFYPPHHPYVVSALERAGSSFRDTLAGRDLLRLGVSEEAFLLDGHQPIAESDRPLAGFASYLCRRGVGVLVFRPPLEQDSLRGLLEVIAMDSATLQSRGGPKRCLEERRLGGVAIEEFDAAAALRSARTDTSVPGPEEATRAPSSWSDLLARFLTGQDKSPPPGGLHLLRRVAGDPEAARQLMASLQAFAGCNGVEHRGAVLTSALSQVAAEVARSEPEALASLARNLAAALMEVDPGCRLDLLQASIPVSGTSLDLGREIRARIPEERIGEMVVSLVQSEGRLNARLTSVIRKVLIDAGGIERHRAAVLEAVREARRPEGDPLADVWKSIENLLEESQDDWISREYKGVLELLGSRTPALDETLRLELQGLPGFQDSLSEAGIRRRAWAMFADLLLVDAEPARQWVSLDQIGKRAEGLSPAWFPECVEVAGAVRAVLQSEPAPAPHVREAAAQALQAVADNLVRASRQQFHGATQAQREALAASFEALGPHGVEPLLRGLEGEEDWEVRKVLMGLLSSRGREAVPVLLRRLADPSWYLVRNVLVILGEIADPATVPAIAPCLTHREARVRRDAVAALGKIGGPRAFALVRGCLGDPEVAEVATRCLAGIDRQRTIAAFMEMTGEVDLLGRRNARLREAITALGALGAHESIPRLQAILLRGLWLPPSAGDLVRIAAARALGKIGTTAALQAVARGTRLWRRPVRAVCSEIVGGRPVSIDPGPVN
jgi:HEAT repeat protein